MPQHPVDSAFVARSCRSLRRRINGTHSLGPLGIPQARGARITLGLLLTATIYLLYTTLARQTFSAALNRPAINSGLESSYAQYGGRWQALYDLLGDMDALPIETNSPYNPSQVDLSGPIPALYGGELHSRDSTVAEALPGAPPQLLHFSADSVDETQGRHDVSATQRDLLDVFRILARKEREEARRRVAGKSKLRDRELQITVTAQ